jgi:hypothetical protein
VLRYGSARRATPVVSSTCGGALRPPTCLCAGNVHWALAAAVPSAGCATTRSSTPRPPLTTQSVEFTATSIGSIYGIQMQLDGTMFMRDNWLYVVVPAGTVRTYQSVAPAWDLTVRAGLATCTGRNRWRVVSEGSAVRIAPLAGFTHDNSMLDTATRTFRDTLRFDLGVPPYADPSHTWLTFDITWLFETVLASYTLHTNAVLVPSEQRPDAARVAATLCRS